MTILVGIGAALTGFAVCWLVLWPAVAERGRLRRELDQQGRTLRAELDIAREELVEARAAAAAAAARLETLEEKLPETVRSISLETLDASREAFLHQAGERVEKTLQPVQQRLGDLRKLVDETEARRLEDGGRLTAQLELLSAGARSLAVALGSTQTRGRWG
jgi:type II secretory pathway component PulM